MRAKLLQSCPTSVCDPMDCSLPGSSVSGVFQARILEWVAVPFSRESPDPGVTRAPSASCIGRQVLYHERHLGSSVLYTVCINRNRSSYRNLWNCLGHISRSRKYYSQSRSKCGTWDTSQELSFSLVSPRYLGITGPLSAGIFNFPRLGISPSYPILPILRSKLALLFVTFAIFYLAPYNLIWIYEF